MLLLMLLSGAMVAAAVVVRLLRASVEWVSVRWVVLLVLLLRMAIASASLPQLLLPLPPPPPPPLASSARAWPPRRPRQEAIDSLHERILQAMETNFNLWKAALGYSHKRIQFV